jgi:hypothetical protein
MSSPEIAIPSDRSFGLTFVVFFAIIAAWQGWAGRASIAYALGGLAIAVLAVSLARPALLHGLNRAWMRFGALLHKVVNPIVLGGIYFLVFTPVAIVMRLAGRDALHRRLDAQAKSYWIDRTPPGPPPDSLPNQY